MDRHEAKPAVAIIATYFGRLPDYFDLWLTSCRFNPGFDWLVFTDSDWSTYDVPANVHMRAMSLAEFSSLANHALGLDVDVRIPYKVCDFRPAYWMLLANAPRAYDFWGHCDLDMVFGRLDGFITDDLFGRFDKIFGVGHLTLYRNCETANRMFQQPYPGLDWCDILSDPNHRGFDEHIGVNRIWSLHGGRVHEDESIIADLDPHVRRLEFLDPVRNRPGQLFYFDRGRVLRGHYDLFGNWIVEEFMYAHFQKRKMIRRECERGATMFALARDGFVALPQMPVSRIFIASCNGLSARDYVAEVPHRFRRCVRQLRKGLGR